MGDLADIIACLQDPDCIQLYTQSGIVVKGLTLSFSKNQSCS